MRVVRLGQGVDATGVLAPEAIERTRAALADYTAMHAPQGCRAGADGRDVAPPATRATATTSSRMVRATLGVDAEVISGDEEARLSFVGAVGELDPDDGPFVVVDVGGGSTELVVGDADDGGPVVRAAARSVDVGCVRITERCLPGDPPTAERGREGPRGGGRDPRRGLRRRAGGGRAHLGRASPARSPRSRRVAQRPARVRPRRRPPLPALAAPTCTASRTSCSAMPRAERAALGPIHPGRIDVIGGGALVVDVLAARAARAGRHHRAGRERARHPRRHRPLLV